MVAVRTQGLASSLQGASAGADRFTVSHGSLIINMDVIPAIQAIGISLAAMNFTAIGSFWYRLRAWASEGRWDREATI